MINDAPRNAEPEHGSQTAAPHPEEMKATVSLRIGHSISLTATARATPAGLVAAALLISAILIPLVRLAGDRKRKHVRAGEGGQIGQLDENAAAFSSLGQHSGSAMDPSVSM